MQNKKFLHLIISSAICLSMALVFLLFYSKLPGNMPIHFDATGRADNYVPKFWAVVGFPAGYLLVNLYAGYSLISKESKKMYRFYIVPAVAVITTFVCIFLAIR